jgi:hypothetical protein
MSENDKRLSDIESGIKKNINKTLKRSKSKKGKQIGDSPSFNSQLMILFITMGIAAILIIVIGFHPNLTFSLPLLMVLGLIMFVVSLTLAAVVLKRMGLACKFEALGLPSGSVRALIALSLIIIFAIMTIYLYSNLGSAPVVLNSNVTVVYPNGTWTSTLNSTSVLTEPTEAQKDFSLQTLTTVSTLVVAIASFYFGTKAANTAKKTSKPSNEGEEEETEETPETPEEEPEEQPPAPAEK